MPSLRLLFVFAIATAAIATIALPCYGNPRERRRPAANQYSAYDHARPRYYRVAHAARYPQVDPPAPQYAGPRPDEFGYGDAALRMEYAAPRYRDRVPPYAWGWFGVNPRPQGVLRTRWDGRVDWQMRYGD